MIYRQSPIFSLATKKLFQLTSCKYDKRCENLRNYQLLAVVLLSDQAKVHHLIPGYGHLKRTQSLQGQHKLIIRLVLVIFYKQSPIFFIFSTSNFLVVGRCGVVRLCATLLLCQHQKKGAKGLWIESMWRNLFRIYKKVI